MGMTAVQENAKQACVVNDKVLAEEMHSILKDRLADSLDTEQRAFLDYLKKVSKEGARKPHGFYVVRNVEGERVVYLCYPDYLNPGTPQRRKITNKPLAMTAMIELVRQKCKALDFKPARSDTDSGVVLANTLGKVGTFCALGVVEEVI